MDFFELIGSIFGFAIAFGLIIIALLPIIIPVGVIILMVLLIFGLIAVLAIPAMFVNSIISGKPFTIISISKKESGE